MPVIEPTCLGLHSHDLVTLEPKGEKSKTRYLLPDNGLVFTDKWRGRRGDYGNFEAEWRRFLEELLRKQKIQQIPRSLTR